MAPKFDEKKYILALDQGTTSSKAIILDRNAGIVTVSSNYPIDVRSPQAGWIEYDPVEIFDSLVAAGRDAISRAGIEPSEIAAIGLANQGETVIAFNRETGAPVGPAISWQDRRTIQIIDRWQKSGLEKEVFARTGLRLDPYFSAAKIRWLLENHAEAAALSQQGNLCLATSDTWLISRLAGLDCCVTDLSTASRTMLLNLKTLEWDQYLLDAFEIPSSILPSLVSNTDTVGLVDEDWLGAQIPLAGLCVDQQAALFGQFCFRPGETKLTYGTGCFMLGNVGTDSTIRSDNLLTSVGWQIEGTTHYVFDGGIFAAGAVVDWMIDRLHLLQMPEEIDELLEKSDIDNDLHFIPALSGLAAPYWEPEARGGWFGLTLSHDRLSLIRSAVEGIAFRVKDIFELMLSSGLVSDILKVDGGLTRSRFLMQLQSDLLGIPVQVMDVAEATAFGAGLMAGLSSGVFSSISGLPEISTNRVVYQPDKQAEQARQSQYIAWRDVVRDVARWPERGIGRST